MGCGCGKKRAATSVTSFTLTTPDGQTSEHSTRLDAQRANLQAGGGGTVKPAKN